MRRLPIGFAVLLAAASFAAAPATRFGHYTYKEAPAAELMDAGPYRKTGRTVKLRKPAAAAFLEMAAAAGKDGVEIIPISGFRPVDYQKRLFENGIKKHGSPREAAKWVAPPGHSEHATGWSLDLGEAGSPATDVEQSFESTAAYRWLERRAKDFSFEISFPKNNAQGVSYEPWHWRFVGNDEARKELRH